MLLTCHFADLSALFKFNILLAPQKRNKKGSELKCRLPLSDEKEILSPEQNNQFKKKALLVTFNIVCAYFSILAVVFHLCVLIRSTSEHKTSQTPRSIGNTNTNTRTAYIVMDRRMDQEQGKVYVVKFYRTKLNELAEAGDRR